MPFVEPTPFSHAVLRRPGPNADQGLTTASLGRPSIEGLKRQHKNYQSTLERIGLKTILLAAEPNFPDAHFVEDTAVVIPELAVITLPGAASRQGEQTTIQPVLARYRHIAAIHPPGTLDGGDVLMVGRHFFIGVSQRTNREGAEQLGAILQHRGYTWEAVQVGEGLHLKSSVNHVGEGTLLMSPLFQDMAAFKPYRRIVVHPGEAYACNTLLVNGHLIMPAGFADTKSQLECLDYDLIELDVSEFRKMDGGLTCMSLRF